MPPTAAEPYRCAVLGAPISHSRSPVLHRAAHRVLGLDWSYEARRLEERELAGHLASRGPGWRGLSLTMPLKHEAYRLCGEADRVARLTGAVNTLLLDPADGTVLRGTNTDVPGIVRALEAAGLRGCRHAWILGNGATAASALLACAELGAEDVLCWARTPSRAHHLVELGRTVGLRTDVLPFDAEEPVAPTPSLVVSTLPGGVGLPKRFSAEARDSALLLDAAYDPWPSPLARSWEEAGGAVLSGLAMLAHQALLQVRFFVTGDPLAPLEREDEALAAMLSAVGLGGDGSVLA